jgi:hypothetical protein
MTAVAAHACAGIASFASVAAAERFFSLVAQGVVGFHLRQAYGTEFGVNYYLYYPASNVAVRQ